jgi:hypothetical protein
VESREEDVCPSPFFFFFFLFLPHLICMEQGVNEGGLAIMALKRETDLDNWIHDTICIALLTILMSPGRIHQNKKPNNQTNIGLGAKHDTKHTKLYPDPFRDLCTKRNTTLRCLLTCMMDVTVRWPTSPQSK